MSKQKSKQITEEKWNTVKLGDVFKTVSENDFEPLKHGLTKYVAGEHIESDKINVIKYGDIEMNKEVIGSAFHKVFRKGQLLFGTRRAYLRKAGIATFEGICANTTLVLEPKNSLYSELFPFIFHWEKFQKHAIENSVGSTNPYVRWRDLANFKFQLPPASEIERISKVLCSIQNSIEKTTSLLDNLQLFHSSLSFNLLTKGIKHKKFKKIEWYFGNYLEIPSEWKMDSLDSVCELKGRIGWKGYTKEDLKDSGPLVLGATQISKDHKLDLSKPVYISKEKYDESPEIQVSFNDIILVKTGNTIGKVGLIEKDIGKTTINPNVGLLKNIIINPKFLYYLLISSFVQKFLIHSGAGTNAQPSINLSTLKKIKIFIPSEKEQEKIVYALSKNNNTIQNIQLHLLQLYHLRKINTDFLLCQNVSKEYTT